MGPAEVSGMGERTQRTAGNERGRKQGFGGGCKGQGRKTPKRWLEERNRPETAKQQFRKFGGGIGDLGNPRYEESLGREGRECEMILPEEEDERQRFW